MEEYYLWVFTGLGLITLGSQWIAWWIKTPSILLLLIAGIIIGPVFHWFSPDKAFGAMLEPMISLAVAVILFEGGLNLTISNIQGWGTVIRNMLTFGLLISLVLTGAVCHYLLGISNDIAWLLGAILAITGPTVIIPMLRSIRPNQRLSNILRWEGICSDPLGAILAVIILTITIAMKSHSSMALLSLSIVETLLVGCVLGIAIGFLLGKALNQQWIPDFLHNVATLCIVLAAYTISSEIKQGTGVLTVTLMGIWLANKHTDIAQELLGFKESLSILLISGLFLLISSQIQPAGTAPILIKALILIAFLQFIIRPISIYVATLRSSLSYKERFFLSWVAPRGIVSASIAALFVLQLENHHVAHADSLLNITLVVIIGTVLFQSFTAIPLARWLNIRNAEPDGILIIGANAVARAIGKALQEHNIQVLLTAINWNDHKKARMEGLPTYYGNPVSEHADRHLDLIGLGKTFGLSVVDDLNALSALRYEKEFGSRSTYGLHGQSSLEHPYSKKHKAAKRHHGQALFRENLSLDTFEHKLIHGSLVRSTLLSDTFTFEQYMEQHHRHVMPLFAITPKGRLQIFTVDNSPKVTSGWTVISLIDK